MAAYSSTYEQANYVATVDGQGASVIVSLKCPLKYALDAVKKYNRGANDETEAWVDEILGTTQAKDVMTSIKGLDSKDWNWLVYSIEMQTGNGGVCDVRITIRGKKSILLAGVDFSVFSRPILGYVVPGESRDEAEKRVTKLVQWSNMKTRDYIDEYIRYQYAFTSDSTSPKSTDSKYYLLDGTNDRYIADKMKRGIENFEMYVPVLTVTMNTVCPPTMWWYGSPGMMRLSQIGTQGDFPSVPTSSGFTAMHASYLNEIVENVKKTLLKIYSTIPDQAHEPAKKRQVSVTWVVTGDSVSMTNDLTYVRRIQFTGFTDVDADLYPNRKTVFGG